ncbi:MAG: hypothetical protein AAF404_21490, partial [Pseudomonadota bacterium]
MSNLVFHAKQQGVVLVALAVTMLLVSGATLLASQLLIDKRLQAADEITVSLAKAKEALISYAVTYTDNYGHNTRGGVGRLPCPAISPHESPATRCGKSALGYLPAVWSRDGKRIDIDYREYFLNQNLWYAVSSEFRYNPSFNHLNPAVSDGLFKVGSREDIVAVIIHPGSDLSSGQSDSNASAVHQLHGENADGDKEFEIGAGVNDRLITISINELMPLMERRVLGIVNDWLVEYYQQNQHYPYAAQLGDPQSQCVEGLLAGAVAMSRGNCTTPALGELVSAIVPKGRAISDT